MNCYFEEWAYHLQGSASMINHKHQNLDSYEIIQIVSGDGNAFLLDRTYPLREGMLLLIDAANLHCITPSDVSNYCRNKLIVDKRYLQEIFEALNAERILHAMLYPQEGRCFYLTNSQAKEVDRLFQSMKQEKDSDPEEHRVKVVAAIMNIFLMCCQTAEEAPAEDDKLTEAMQYLRMHFAEPMTLDQIAAKVHMSKYYLCHLFHEKTGLTLMQYLYEQRLAEARRQLQQPSLSISEVALNCGFGSSSYFSTLFRRKEGLSPSEYRRKVTASLTMEKAYSKMNERKGM